MPLSGPALPQPKDAQLARGERRYHRKVASPKQWQAIIEAKRAPCRCCGHPDKNTHLDAPIQFHHLVSRQDGGDDVAENIVPLCSDCHGDVTVRAPTVCRILLARLTDAEYAYMTTRGGENYGERAYGIEYRR